MRRLEAFSGIRVLTYALMSNHFHLLCEVPQAQELSEAELLERIQAGYGPARRQALDQQLALLRQAPDGADQIQRFLQPYRNRLFDLSSFIKELKGRNPTFGCSDSAFGIAITVSSPTLPFQILVFHRSRRLFVNVCSDLERFRGISFR